MNYIRTKITVLGLTSILSGTAVAVNAQPPRTYLKQTNFQQQFDRGVQKL